MREMSFMEEAFVAEWATFVGQALDWEGFQHWPRSLVGVGNIGKWGYEESSITFPPRVRMPKESGQRGQKGRKEMSMPSLQHPRGGGQRGAVCGRHVDRGIDEQEVG